MFVTYMTIHTFLGKVYFEQDVPFIRQKLVNTAPSIDNVCTNTFLPCSSLYVDIHQVHNVATHTQQI